MASRVLPRDAGDGSFFKPKRVLKRRDARGWPVGPRTKMRIAGNRELNKLPDSIKNFCEIGLPGCLRDKFLQWAHPTKSRFISTAKDWATAARSCTLCHDYLDNRMSHADMRKIVNEAIQRRTPDEYHRSLR